MKHVEAATDTAEGAEVMEGPKQIDQNRCVPATAVVKVSISESTSGSVCSVLVERSRDLDGSVD